jgi:dipeptidyl-peptidase-4
VRAGKDHELVVIPGAGHGAAETPYGSMKRLEFLTRHLCGAEAAARDKRERSPVR